MEPLGVAGEVNPWNCLNPCCHVFHPHQGSGESTAKCFRLGRQYLKLQGDFFIPPDKEASHRPREDSRGNPYCRKKNCQAGTAHTCRAKRGPGHLAASPGPGPASGPCGMLSLTQMSAPLAPCCPAHLCLPTLWLCISDLLLSTAGHLLLHSLCRRTLSSPRAQWRLQQREKQSRGFGDGVQWASFIDSFSAPLLSSSLPLSKTKPS